MRALLVITALVLPMAMLPAQVPQATYQQQERYTTEELDNLLAPVALYPDPILAQVLVAASYPDDVEAAARYVRVNGTAGIDQQPWEISVRAVAHYAPVLNLMADRIDWTIALGQAHASQPGDVMASVQRLRSMARAQGNLVSTAEQEVRVEREVIYIEPARPYVVYVPVYDPIVVYHRPVVYLGMYRSDWSFGIGFPIGVWLNYDVDWHQRHVYYHGWDTHRHRNKWYHRSRQHVVVNNIYVNPRHTTIVINHTVINRRVDYRKMSRYTAVHRGASWDRRRDHEDRRRDHEDRRVAQRRDHDRNDGPSWDRGRGRQDDRGRSDDRNNGGRTVDRRVADSPSWDRSGRRERSPQRTQPGRAPERATPERRTAPDNRLDAARRVAAVTRTPRVEPQRAQPQRTQPERIRSTVPRSERRSEPRAAPRTTARGQSASSPRSTKSAERTAKPRNGNGGRNH